MSHSYLTRSGYKVPLLALVKEVVLEMKHLSEYAVLDAANVCRSGNTSCFPFFTIN